jgi:hypothetical protein
MAKTVHRRAYINPLPGYGEAAQRADILKSGPIDEWYVESNKTKRHDFIRHLREGDHALVAHFGCLAKATGRIDARISDLLEARGDIHAKGCAIFDAGGVWVNSKAAIASARTFLLAQRSIKNGSARQHRLTDAQVRRVLEIRDSKRYTNDPQRLTALRKEGIEIGRTYMVTMVPIITRERGITI